MCFHRTLIKEFDHDHTGFRGKKPARQISETENGRLLSAAVRQTADSVAITDREGVIVYINSAFEKMTGYTSKEALGNTPRLLKSGRHEQEFYEIMWRTILSGDEYRAVCINKKKTGELYHAENTITQIVDEKGGITHFVCTAKDITLEKLAEEELKRSAESIQAVFASSPQGIGLADLDGKMRECNQAYQEITGYSREEIMRLTIADYYPTEKLAELQTHWETLNRTGSVSFESVNVRNNGELYPISVSAALMTDDEGKPGGIVANITDISKRKQAEEKLKQALADQKHKSEELAQSKTTILKMLEDVRSSAAETAEAREYAENITNSMTDALFVLNSETLIESVNPAACKLLGYSEEELLGQPAAKIMPEEEEEEEEQKVFRGAGLEKLMRTGFVRGTQKTLLAKDGSKAPVLFSGSVMKGADGAVQGIVCLGQDISKLLRAEAQLKESEEKYRQLFEHESDAIMIADAENMRIEEANPAASALFGYSREEFRKLSVEDVSAEKEQTRKAVVRISEKGEVSPYQRDLVKKDGTVFYGEVSPGQFYAGGRTKIIGAVRDLTDRQRMENELLEKNRELEQQTNLLETIINSMSEGVVAIDGKGTLILRNNSIAKIVGKNDTSLPFKKWPGTLGVYHSDKTTRYRADELPIVRAAMHGESLDRDIYIRNPEKPDGVFVAVSARPLKDHEGKLQGGLAVFYDVTERKQMEEILRNAKDQAEKATVAKSRYLANMSHEIRTPLNSIVGFSQILLQQSKSLSLNKEFRHYLNTIKNSSLDLSELINNILDLSRIEAGKYSLFNEPLNLKLLVQGIYHQTLKPAEEKELDFNYEFDPYLPEMVISDRTKLNQILMNLVGNAIKFTGQAGKVRLKAQRKADMIVLRVEDEGIGIPREKQEIIFEGFERLENGESREQEGTGLGLTIVRKMTELLGGAIELRSAPGKGSVFSVTLPLREAEKGYLTRENNAGETMRFAPGQRVLVVEDNPDNKEMIQVLLQNLGLSVELAGGGEEGVAMAIELQPELVLMDVDMPGLDGLEATRKIRAHPSGKGSPSWPFPPTRSCSRSRKRTEPELTIT